MTREERKKAIEILDDMIVKIDIPKSAKTQNDRSWALDVAIKALSQEPTEKPMTVDEMEREYEKSKVLFHKIVECDDAISREDVCKLIVNYRDEHTKMDSEICLERAYGANEIGKLIEQLPPVTQKSGKWITTRTFMHDGEYYCDRCKCDAPNNEKWDYCPNCGSAMKGE